MILLSEPSKNVFKATIS